MIGAPAFARLPRGRGPALASASRLGLVLVLGVLGLLVLPGVFPASAVNGPGGRAFPALSADLGPATTNLTVSAGAFNLSSDFWGTTVSPRAPLLPNEADLINATPTQTIVWPGGSTGDEYDPLTNTLYNPSNGLGTTNVSTSAPRFATWCHTFNCSTIFELPGEIDNATIAAQIVSYTENTLDLHPTYWEIGNEPERWNNWRIPWTQQSNLNQFTVSPIQYAWEVHNYTAAIRTVDPGAHIIGLPGTGRQNGQYPLSEWVNATIEVNGPNLSAIAFHEYPGGKASVATLSGFYGALNSPAGLPARVDSVRRLIDTAISKYCAQCAPIPVFVTEIGSALSHSVYANYSAGFPGALDMAAQMTQAMGLNLSNADLYASVFNTANSWFNLTGSPRPDYATYATFLRHLGTETFLVNVSGYSHTVYAIATTAPNDGGRADLLVVNTNLSSSVAFAPVLPGVSASSPTESWAWDGSVLDNSTNNSSWVIPQTPNPVSSFAPDGVSNWTLPPQSMVLLEAYPGNATAVRFVESGLPAGARWFLGVDHAEETTVASNFTVLLGPGSHTVAPVALAAPLGRLTPSRLERIEPFTSSPITVGPGVANLTELVSFVTQWRTNISAVPYGGGTVVPAPSWANGSAPLTLAATASPGYRFTEWFGWGPGSLNSTNSTITLDPTGALSEKAHFVSTHLVEFLESGLPNGAPWSVSLRGINNSSTTAQVGFYVPYAGLYGFTVGNSGSYDPIPASGRVNVSGNTSQVLVRFVNTTAPPGTYEVVFAESGLPTGSSWSVTLHGQPATTTNSTLAFSEPNGTWAFAVGNVSGYRARPAFGSVNVSGQPVLIAVDFAPIVTPVSYRVAFIEYGLPLGTLWQVTVRGSTNVSTSDAVGFTLPNGTFGFQVGAVAGFRSVPTNSSVTVNGSARSIAINFSALSLPPPKYSVEFSESGLPVGTTWSVTVRNVTELSATSIVLFQEANGSYGYGVGAVPGYLPPAWNKGFDVAGGAVTVTVAFQPSSWKVLWTETGLWKNTSWSVLVNGTFHPNHGSWVNVPLAAGTYSYAIEPVAGYLASPRNGTVRVQGPNLSVAIHFTQARFEVRFAQTGLPVGAAWGVRVANDSNETADGLETFELPNGTYTFDVVSPVGFHPTPSHGNVTVTASVSEVQIRFLPNGPGAVPSVWFLLSHAAYVGGFILAAGLSVFVLLRRRQRGRGEALL